MKEYLLAVTAAALICCVAGKMIRNGTPGAVIRLICSIFMILTVLSPWLSVRLDTLHDVKDTIWLDAAAAAGDGENLAREVMTQHINRQSRAYILDKANALGVSLDVQVTVSQEQLPVPVGVTIIGAVSPYVRSVLTQYISENLGIKAEEQIWIQS